MKKNHSISSLLCCSAVWLLSACGANGVEDTTALREEADSDRAPSAEPALDGLEAAPSERNQCGGAVDRNLANLAGAAAEELGRWEALKDFQIAADGTRLELSAEGAGRCGSSCGIVNGVLSLQWPEAAMPDNVPEEFAAALVSGWQRQKAQEGSSPSPGEHQLTRIGSEPSRCGGSTFWFEAERANCSGDCAVMTPDALRFKLLFAGFPDNQFLEFQSALDFQGEEKSVVGIDPTYGPDDDPTTSFPICTAACTKISSTNLAGECCSCGGITKQFVKAAWNNTTFLCM